MSKDISQTNFFNNLEYIIIHLEKDIYEVKNLEDKNVFRII